MLKAIRLLFLACLLHSPALAQWEEVQLDTGATPYLDVHFVAPSTGMVVGGYGTALRTTNAGDRWTKMTLEQCDECITHYEMIKFFTHERGYIFGRKIAKYNERLIFKTTDAGLTWQRVGAPVWDSVERYEELKMQMPEEGYLFAYDAGNYSNHVYGSDGDLTLSTDWGITWSDLTSPIGGGQYYGIGDVIFADHLNGLATKGGYTTPPLATTLDGGKTWAQKWVSLYTIDHVADNVWLGSTLLHKSYPNTPSYTLRSTDGWLTWDTVARIRITETAFHFSIGYGSASTPLEIDTFAGRIAKTTDFGERWGTQKLTDSAYHLTALAVPSALYAYVLIDSSRLFRTSNGGGPMIDLPLKVRADEDKPTSIIASLERNILTIQFETIPAQSEAELFDNLGRRVAVLPMTRELRQQIEIEGLATGVYHLSIDGQRVSLIKE